MEEHKKIETIEQLAELIQNTMASKEDLKQFPTKTEMKENFDMVFHEIDGLRDTIKQDQTARRIIDGDIQERVKKVEADVATLRLQNA